MAAGSRIAVEISGSSSELVAAVAKASDSLKGLGDVLAKQTDVAVSMGDKTVRSNDLVAKSFQTVATEAGLASDKTVAAFERQGAVLLGGAREQQAALGETAQAAEKSADTQVKASETAAAASTRAADTHVAAARKTEQAFGSSSSALTKAGKYISLGLLGAAAASADLAVKFQANTLRMQTQAGATTQQLAKLRQGLLDMAGQVGYTPDQLANGLYHVVSSMNAVLPAASRVTDELHIMKIAAEGAQVGHANLEDTTYALASALNALHDPGTDAGKVMGDLNAIVGAGDMTMQDLVDAFKSGIIPGARTAGLSLQSVGAAMAVMGDMGMRGALAGTRLRMSIALLSSPSEAAAKILDTLGMSATQATSTSRAMAKALQDAGLRTTTLSADLKKPDGFMVALADLNNHLRESGLTATGAAAVMNKAFGGGRMGATITLLAENTGRLNTKFDQIGDSANKFGADWQKQGQTTAQQLHNIEAGAVSLGTRMGTDLLPVGEKAIHDFTALVHWFEEGSTAAHDLEIAIGTLATVAIGSYLVSNLMKAIKLMRELGTFVNNPLGIGGAMNRATAPTALGGTSPLSTGGVGMISGARGFEAPGSIANPIIVAMEAGEYAGLSSMGAAGTVSNEMNTAKAETGAAEKMTGVALPTAATAATGAEEAAGAGMLATMKSGFNTLLGGLLKGGLIAGLGTTGAHLAGSVVGGKTGSAISTVGTAAAIGGGIGSVVPGIGTVAGALTGALVGGLDVFIKEDAAKYGTKIADAITKPMGDAVSKQVQSGLADAANKAHNLGNVAKQAVKPGTQIGPRFGGGRFGGITQGDTAGASAAVAAQQQAQFVKEGQDAAKAFTQGFGSVDIKTEPQFIADAMATLKKLPPQARDTAAAEMVSYATSLEQNGKLPKGATDGFIMSIEDQYSGLSLFLQSQGKANATVVAHSMKFDGAVTNLVQTEQDVRGKFGLWATDPTINGGNVIQAFGQEMSQLKTIAADSTGQAHDAAMSEMNTLRTDMHGTMTGLQQDTADTFGQMLSNVKTTLSNMAVSIAQGTAQSATTAQTNFTKFASSVEVAMNSGAVATSKGMQLIAQAADATITAFGGTKIPIPALVQNMKIQGLVGSGQTGPSAALHAAGGLIQIGKPGDAGRDTVPMNVGGQGIVVGSGEQVAVFNRHQQAVANSMMAPIGGLSGLFSSVTKPNYMASGGFVGNNTSGGTLSYGQLEQLWIQGGGPSSVATTAAAIALAESSGRDVMQQGQPFATTGWGYWQITPGGPQYLVPINNAREAVSKYEAAGNTFRPWTTFMDGAYRQFLQGGVGPASLAGVGAIGQITAPQVSGKGAISAAANAALSTAANAANTFLGTLAPSGAGGGGAGGGAGAVGPAGAGFNPADLSAFDGLQVAKWIIPELLWARDHGWAGHVTSGYRSPTQVVHGEFATAPQGQSEHQYDIYPGGAVDVSDYQQFAQVIAGYPGADKLIQLPIDPLHFSGTGHALGGLLGFATGTSNVTGAKNAHVATAPKKYAKAPAAKTKTFPKIPPLGSIATTDPILSKGLGKLNSLLGQDGTIAKLQDEYQSSDELFNAEYPDLTYVVTQDPTTGASIAPYIDPNAVSLATGHYDYLEGLEQQIIGTYQKSVIPLVTTLVPRIQKAIQQRRDQIAAIRSQIEGNLATISALQTAVKAAQNKSGNASLTDQLAALRLKLSQTPDTKKNKAARAALSAQIAQLSYQKTTGSTNAGIKVTDLQGQITQLEDENRTLGGSETTLGTGGQISTLNKQISTLTTGLGTVQSDQVDAVGPSGSGGALNDANVALIGLQTDLKPLDPTTLGIQLAYAQSNYAPTSTTTADDVSSLIGELETETSEATTLMTAQTSVLQGMFNELGGFGAIPSGGIPQFAKGGPVLDDGLAVVHKGEHVVPQGGTLVSNGGGPTNVHIHQHFHGKAGELMQFVDQRVQHPGNVMAISKQIGRRTSMLSNRPGARRTDRI